MRHPCPKHLSLLSLFILFLLLSSCQRSMFTTTIRNYNNGKTSYAASNHYLTWKSLNNKWFRNHLKLKNGQIPVMTGSKHDSVPVIEKIPSILNSSEEKLIASVVPKPASIKGDELEPGMSEKPVRSYITVRSLVRSFSRPADMPSAASPNRGQKALHSDIRKTEKHALAGFILSILGLFPVIGLPFAIAGLILSIKGLRKIHRDPADYKGRGFAVTGIVAGVFGICFSLAFIGLFIALAVSMQAGSAG
jgi:hypothetical protein